MFAPPTFPTESILQNTLLLSAVMNSILLFLLVSSAVLLFSRNAIEAQSDENRDYQLTTFDFNLTCKLGKAFCFQVGVWSVLYPEHSE